MRRVCDEFIAHDLEEYKATRSLPTLFLVAPGHQTPQVENVVETNDLYALVEKIREVELDTESESPLTTTSSFPAARPSMGKRWSKTMAPTSS